MDLSKHFKLAEFLCSETAVRNDIDMRPPDDVVKNLTRLANEVLEPIREAAGCSILVTSGYRPRSLNVLIGGALNSDHIFGRAADIVAPDLMLHEFARIAKKSCESLPVAKVIIEFGEWVHVSIEPLGTPPRREFLYASRENGITVYREWV